MENLFNPILIKTVLNISKKRRKALIARDVLMGIPGIPLLKIILMEETKNLISMYHHRRHFKIKTKYS